MDDEKKSVKKAYDFGEVDIVTFEELSKTYVSSAKLYSVYAYIPICDSADIADGCQYM